jgi:hypothetical protein
VLVLVGVWVEGRWRLISAVVCKSSEAWPRVESRWSRLDALKGARKNLGYRNRNDSCRPAGGRTELLKSHLRGFLEVWELAGVGMHAESCWWRWERMRRGCGLKKKEVESDDWESSWCTAQPVSKLLRPDLH